MLSFFLLCVDSTGLGAQTKGKFIIMLKSFWKKIFNNSSEESHSDNALQSLPINIFLLILAYLKLDSIMKIGATSRYFNKISNDVKFWKNPYLFLSDEYLNLFSTLNYLKNNNNKSIVPLALISNQEKQAEILGKKFRLVSSIPTSAYVPYTNACIDDYIFQLYEDFSLRYAAHYDLTMLRSKFVIVFFPQNTHNLLLLSEELKIIKKKIVDKIFYPQHHPSIIFTLVDENLLPDINQQKSTLSSYLSITNFFVKLPKTKIEMEEAYDLDAILYDVTAQLNQLTTRHHSFLTKQKRILSHDDASNIPYNLPQLHG